MSYQGRFEKEKPRKPKKQMKLGKKILLIVLLVLVILGGVVSVSAATYYNKMVNKMNIIELPEDLSPGRTDILLLHTGINHHHGAQAVIARGAVIAERKLFAYIVKKLAEYSATQN